jgi:hypothetical protein
MKYVDYWNGACRNFAVSFASFCIAHICMKSVSLNPYIDYLSWGKYCSISLCMYIVINLSLITLCCKGAKSFYVRLVSLIIKK